MPKNYRLTRADFVHIGGFRRLHGALFSLSFGDITGRRTPGFACVVSAKMASRASARNLIKRRCRAAFTHVVDKRSSRIYVYYAKRSANGASFSAIECDVKALYERARLLA